MLYAADPDRITAAALQPSVWVSAEFVPSVQLDVAFPDSGKRVQLGNFITPEEGAGALLVKIHAEVSPARLSCRHFGTDLWIPAVLGLNDISARKASALIASRSGNCESGN